MTKKSKLPRGVLSVFFSPNPSCGRWRPMDRLRYWQQNYLPEWHAWFLEDVLGRSYDVEYLMNDVSLGADFQLSRRSAEEMARSYAYSYSWAYLDAIVRDRKGVEVFSTVVPRPNPAELRTAAANLFPRQSELEYKALMEYADRLEAGAADTERKS